MNKTILIGRLGKDAELKVLGEKKVAKFSLAVDDGKDREGNKKTTWFFVTLFSKTAPVVAQYLTKGKQVAVEGSVSVFKMQDGTPALQLSAFQVELLGGGGDAKPKPAPAGDDWLGGSEEPF